jgi:hypothetical protein
MDLDIQGAMAQHAAEISEEVLALNISKESGPYAFPISTDLPVEISIERS